MNRILIVEDNPRMTGFLETRLQANGFVTAVVNTGREAIRLAELFLRHPMQVLTRVQLLDRIWGYDYDPGTNIVNVYVGDLRRKLGKTESRS
jgi:DNA-binding response OmpR family regulator